MSRDGLWLICTEWESWRLHKLSIFFETFSNVCQQQLQQQQHKQQLNGWVYWKINREVRFSVGIFDQRTRLTRSTTAGPSPNRERELPCGPCGQAQVSLSNGSNDDEDDDDKKLATLLLQHYYLILGHDEGVYTCNSWPILLILNILNGCYLSKWMIVKSFQSSYRVKNAQVFHLEKFIWILFQNILKELL